MQPMLHPFLNPFWRVGVGRREAIPIGGIVGDSVRSDSGLLVRRFWEPRCNNVPRQTESQLLRWEYQLFRCSASITFVRMSLMSVRWPWPLDLSHSRTCGSRRTLTGTFRLTSRSRTRFANCSSVRRGISRKSISASSPDAWRWAARRSARRSFSVHRLFLISSDLMLFRPAGRDDTDDFFTITVLPIGVDRHEHDDALRLDADFPNGVPPLFSCFVKAVRADQAAFVLEDE